MKAPKWSSSSSSPRSMPTWVGSILRGDGVRASPTRGWLCVGQRSLTNIIFHAKIWRDSGNGIPQKNKKIKKHPFCLGRHRAEAAARGVAVSPGIWCSPVCLLGRLFAGKLLLPRVLDPQHAWSTSSRTSACSAVHLLTSQKRRPAEKLFHPSTSRILGQVSLGSNASPRHPSFFFCFSPSRHKELSRHQPCGFLLFKKIP